MKLSKYQKIYSRNNTGYTRRKISDLLVPLIVTTLMLLLSFCEQEVPILAGTGDPVVFIDTTFTLSSATTKYSEALSTEDYYIYTGKSGNTTAYGLLRFNIPTYLDTMSVDSIVSVTFRCYSADFYSLDTNLNSASISFYFIDGDTLWNWSDDSTYIKEKPDMDLEPASNSLFYTYDPFQDYDSNDVEIDIDRSLFSEGLRDEYLVMIKGEDLENEDFYAIYSSESSYDPYFDVVYIEKGDTTNKPVPVTADLTVSEFSATEIDTTSDLAVIEGGEYSVLLNFPVDTIANMIENDNDLIIAKSELLLPIDTDKSQLYNHSMPIRVNMLDEIWYESFLRENISYNAAATISVDDTLAVFSTTYQLQEIVVNEGAFEGFLISARYTAFDLAKLVFKNDAEKKPKLRVILVQKVAS